MGMWLTCVNHSDADSCWVLKDGKSYVWCYTCGPIAVERAEVVAIDVMARRAAKRVVEHWDEMVKDSPQRAAWDYADVIDDLRRALDRTEKHVYQPDPAYPGDPVARCAQCHTDRGSSFHVVEPCRDRHWVFPGASPWTCELPAGHDGPHAMQQKTGAARWGVGRDGYDYPCPHDPDGLHFAGCGCDA